MSKSPGLAWSSALSGGDKWSSNRSCRFCPPCSRGARLCTALCCTSTRAGWELGAPAHCLGQSYNIPNPTHIHTRQCTHLSLRSRESPGVFLWSSALARGSLTGLLGTSKSLPSCQWDTSSPWLHFLSASLQVQGWEANSQAISIFNADQGCVGAARWDIHTGSAEQAGGAGEAHQPPVNRQR